MSKHTYTDALELILSLIAFGLSGILALTLAIYYVYGGGQ